MRAAVFVVGARGFSARERPSALEQWVARRVRGHGCTRRRERSHQSDSEFARVLAEARAHWADHCAGCHANNGSGDTEMGKRMYPPAPDMRQAETQQMTDGELFFIIQNGIRMTGMPAWGGWIRAYTTNKTPGNWCVSSAICRKLTAEEEHEMQSLNPKSPDEIEGRARGKRILEWRGTT